MNPHGLPSAGSRFDRDASQRYTRRRPEESVLYRVVAAELETFLARAQASERTVPRFVEREFRNFLACGILAHGFVRVHCDACGFDRLVAFDVDLNQLDAFIAALQAALSEDEFSALAGRWGVRRTDPQFWPTMDWFVSDFQEQSPTEAGLFDLARYGNY